MVIRVVALSAFLICCSFSYAEEAVEIPLSEVWAHGMPGTRRIHDLAEDPKRDHPLMLDIWKEHSFARGKKPAGPALAVEGTGVEALKNAHAVITGLKSRSDSLSKDHEVSIVFFTLISNRYIHLTKVTKSGADHPGSLRIYS